MVRGGWRGRVVGVGGGMREGVPIANPLSDTQNSDELRLQS